MECEVPIRLVLLDPPSGVDFGIQSGSGAKYETLFVKQALADTSHSTIKKTDHLASNGVSGDE